ncbi:MAG: hypothetical protein RIF36_00040 [Imperialibacter sp.]|uniref:hypothetical protein n=1 Tax=Imperialibacter sp. TaxID=2038411 RepID=UPI0032EE9669
MVKPNAVIDISALIWDKADFLSKQHNYYGLVANFPLLLSMLEKERLPVLLRNELIDEISLAFPWQEVPSIFNEFRTRLTLFLAKAGPRIVSFATIRLVNIKTIPEIKKGHFSRNTVNESEYLISKMHVSNDIETIYFTFAYLWSGVDKLATVDDDRTQEYTTVVCDNNLASFFESIRPTFEHNKKHDKKPGNDKTGWKARESKDNFESRLSCYNGMDNILPQKLLDASKEFGDRRYVYDQSNETYVVFMAHMDNKYHGFDEYDPDKIPTEIKEIFYIHKY